MPPLDVLASLPQRIQRSGDLLQRFCALLFFAPDMGEFIFAQTLPGAFVVAPLDAQQLPAPLPELVIRSVGSAGWPLHGPLLISDSGP